MRLLIGKGVHEQPLGEERFRPALLSPSCFKADWPACRARKKYCQSRGRYAPVLKRTISLRGRLSRRKVSAEGTRRRGGHRSCIRSFRIVTASWKVFCTFGCAEGIEASADGLPRADGCAAACFTRKCLEPGEGVLDGVEVGAAGLKKLHLRADCFTLIPGSDFFSVDGIDQKPTIAEIHSRFRRGRLSPLGRIGSVRCANRIAGNHEGHGPDIAVVDGEGLCHGRLDIAVEPLDREPLRVLATGRRRDRREIALVVRPGVGRIKDEVFDRAQEGLEAGGVAGVRGVGHHRDSLRLSTGAAIGPP